MVVVHELGHFIVAKLCGVRVESFSVGFGPRLFGIKRGDTDYKVCLLPLGGYVKMAGENPGEEFRIDDPSAFQAQPRWHRMLIGVAGPLANFILAFVLMFLYFGWINEVPDVRTTTLEWVTPGSPADLAGLKPGDVVSRLGGVDHPDLETVFDMVRSNASQVLPVTVERDGQPVTMNFHVPRLTELNQTGVFPAFVKGPIVVDQLVPGAPAQRAGLKPGDRIVSADGHQFHTVEPLLDYLQVGRGKPVTLTVERDGQTLPPIVVNPSEQESEWRLGFMPQAPDDPPMKRKPLGIAGAAAEARDFCAENSLMIFDVLHKLFTRQASVKQLAGPVGIAHAAGQAAQTKFWAPKFELAASISLNLGILNLLPFPILDGGLILLLIIESALRHDISMVVKERIYQAAFVVLVMFFVYVSFNDVAKLAMFHHAKP